MVETNYLKEVLYKYLKEEKLLSDPSIANSKKFFFVWDVINQNHCWVSQPVLEKLGYENQDQENDLLLWNRLFHLDTITVLNNLNNSTQKSYKSDLEFKKITGEKIMASVTFFSVQKDSKMNAVVGVLNTDWNDVPVNYSVKQFEILLDLYKSSYDAFIDENNLYEVLTKQICEGLGVSRAGIWSLTESQIKCKKLYDTASAAYESGKTIYKKDSPLYFSKLQEGISLAVPVVQESDYAKELGIKYLQPLNIKSMLDIPLRENGLLTGVLCCENLNDYRDWSENDISFARSIANILSLILEEFKRKEAESLLQKKQDDFTFISNNISDGIFVVEDDIMTFASNSYLEMLGLTIQEKARLRNEDIFHLVHPDDLDYVQNTINTTINEKKSNVKFVFRCKRANGEYFWREDIMNVYFNVGSIKVKTISITRDVTDEKNEEIKRTRKQKSIEKQNQLLVKLYTDSVNLDLENKIDYITDIAVKGLDINCANYWEIEGDHLICKKLQDIVAEDTKHNHSLYIRKMPKYFKAISTQIALIEDEVMTNEFASELIDNYLKPLGITEILDIPVREKGIIKGVLCFEHRDDPRVWTDYDITFARVLADFLTLSFEEEKRILVEEALLINQEKLRFISENTSDGIVVFENSKITYVSPAYTKLSGYTEEYLKTISITEVFNCIHPEDIANITKVVYGNLANRVTKFSYEYRFKGPDGVYAWREDSANVVYDETDKKYATYIIISRDISERKRTEQKLIENEQQLRLISENSSDGFILMEKRKISYISPSFCEFLGYSVEELLHKSSEEIFESMHPDDKYVVKELVDYYLKNKITSFKFEYRTRDKAGNYQWREDSTNVIYSDDPNEAYHQYIIISRDINERKEIERQLIESEQQLRLIFENSTDGFVVIENKLLKYISPSYQKVLGFSNEELKDFTVHKIFELIHPEDFLKTKNYVDENLKNKVSGFTCEFRIKSKDGKYYWREDLANVIYNEDGSYSKYIITSRDIEERKEIENQLIESEKQLRLITENTSDGVAVIEEGKLTYVSPSFAKLIGLEKNFYKNFTLEEVFANVHPDDEEKTRETIYSGLEKKLTEIKYEHRFKLGDGGYHWREDSANIIYDENGDYTKYIVVTRDISDRKEAEKEKNRLYKIAEKQNEKLINFTHIVSHDIRSHTSNLSMILDLYEESSDPVEQKEYFDMLKQSTNKLSDTIFYLNETVAVQSGVKNEKSFFNLKEEIEKTIVGINAIVLTSKADIFIDVDPTLQVLFTQSYLESIIFNLLTNAIKYKSPDRLPIITITATKNDDEIILSVTDNGIGIDLEKNKNKIFGMYKTFAGNPDAVGLGLFMVKNHIESMGGRIEVASTLGKGTTFKLFFI